MPVAFAKKVEALRVDFRSAAQLADMLGVSRSQVTRWLRGAGIDPLNAEKVDLLEMVWSNLLRLYDRDAALEWLFGINPLLGDRRPIDLIRMGRAEELMRAIRAERSDTFA
jgi:transcriptional regulator with XRE-family HTH domain